MERWMDEVRKAGVMDVLHARDARAARQQALLKRHCTPLISFTMNIAGEIKRDPWIERAFRVGAERIEKQLSWHEVPVLESICTIEFTGCEQLWAVQAETAQLKAWMQAVEEADELGRLFDIDVIDINGSRLERAIPRRCLICDGPAKACGRSRSHPAQELYLRAQSIIRAHFEKERAGRIARCAQQALLYEALCTPKPGLVDRENSGAHSDMDIFSFAASTAALGGYFEACARSGMAGSALENLRFLGRQAEADMLCATGGANAHKGAIFSLGILCCAAAMEGEVWENAAHIAAPALGDFEKLRAEQAQTGGERQYLQYGLSGVRGEAAAGFPMVKNIALPALKRAIRNGKSLNDAGLEALMSLMTVVFDSNILRRRGMEIQQWVHERAKELLDSGWTQQDLRELNDGFIQENISPGGCADLLAAAWFIYFLEKEGVQT